MGDDGRDGGGGNLSYKIDPRTVAKKRIRIVLVMYPRGVARGARDVLEYPGEYPHFDRV